jgi:hypothetical protein
MLRSLPMAPLGLLDHLPIGLVRRSKGRTVSGAELDLLKRLTRTDAEPGYGSLVWMLMSGLQDATSIPHGIMKSHHLHYPAGLAAEGELFADLRPDDTIWCETKLLSARASSTPGRGVMVIEDRCFNQRGEDIARRRRTFLFERTA